MSLTPPASLYLTTVDNLLRILDHWGSTKLKSDTPGHKNIILARRQVIEAAQTREEWGHGPPEGETGRKRWGFWDEPGEDDVAQETEAG